MNEGAANEVPGICPADRGIEKKLPRPREFEAQIGWIREQLDLGRIDCAYHGENHAVAIVNAESREDLDQL